MKCVNPSCLKDLHDDWLVCPYCGTKQERPKIYCTKCGAAMDEDDLFCSFCGQKSALVILREEEARRSAEQEAARKKKEDELREKGISGSLNGHDYVDLGLSVKWATCNLGASKPEDFGGYYQWAGLQDVTDTSIDLDFSNCPYHTGSKYSTGWTKYIPSNMSSHWSGSGNPDNKTVLDPEDDVAHVRLGGKWRMPTEAEFQELIDNCTSGLTTLNGVKGKKFTSKKNGNSIFLPAAGYRRDGNLSYVGSSGIYWFSSLCTGGPGCACGICFGPCLWSMGSFSRYYGNSVRPVSE